MNLVNRLLSSISIIICTVSYSFAQPPACLEVTSPTCPEYSGTYVYAVSEEIYYLNEDIYIEIDNNPNAWYFYDNNTSNYPFYNLSIVGPFPTSGWLVYDPCNGQMRDDPADITVQIGECQRLNFPCYEVTSECPTISGVYSAYGTYNGAPLYFDNEGNQIYFNGNKWHIYDTQADDVYESETTDGSAVPISGWVLDGGTHACTTFPAISFAEIECPDLRSIPTLSQWSLMLLGLILLIFGIVMIKQRNVLILE